MRMFISLSKAFGSRIFLRISRNCASRCICSTCFFLNSCNSASSISLRALVQNAFSFRSYRPPCLFFLDQARFFQLLQREADCFSACLAVVAAVDFVVGFSTVLVPQAFGLDRPVLENLVEKRSAPAEPDVRSSGNTFVVGRRFYKSRPLWRLYFLHFLQFFRSFFDNALNRFV